MRYAPCGCSCFACATGHKNRCLFWKPSFGSSETMDIGPMAPYEEGYNAGSNGCAYHLCPNPYLPGGGKYDGADTMGEACAWWKGWMDARVKTPYGTDDYGKDAPKLAKPKLAKSKAVKVSTDLDYLESERG